jgi:hypothetical protein
MLSDIEKENLEAHVELCAERYKQLYMKLDSLDIKATNMENLVSEIKTTLAEANDKHNRQLITIGTGIILSLMGGILTLIIALNRIG